MIFDVSLEMKRHSKIYVRLQDKEKTELVHTIKSAYASHDTQKIAVYIGS